MVQGKRNAKNFADVKSFSRKAYKSIDNEWIPLDSLNAEEVIGISYKNFRRTVIIPQGKFQEFLQLPPTARSEMLKEIFNLKKYDLRDKIAWLSKKNDENIHHLEGALKKYNASSKELLNTKGDILKNLETSIQKSYVERDELSVNIEQLRKIKQLVDEHTVLKNKSKTLSEKQSFIDNLEKELNLI